MRRWFSVEAGPTGPVAAIYEGYLPTARDGRSLTRLYVEELAEGDARSLDEHRAAWRALTAHAAGS